MPIVLAKTAYKYAELSDKAKSKARVWYSSISDDFNDDCVIDYAANIAYILGVDLCQTRKMRMDGSHFYAPTVYYSGFCSQGDGASFVGEYVYKKGASKAIRKYSPDDKELHRIADELQAIQKRYFYNLKASITHNGRYYHSGYMYVSLEHALDCYRDVSDAEDDIKQLMRDFADWIYKRLEQEYFFTCEDEYLEEQIIANDYLFDEKGNFEGN